jgi:hypothetical protein
MVPRDWADTAPLAVSIEQKHDMALQHWTLTDVSERIREEPFHVAAEGALKLAGAPNWSVSKTTLRGGLSDGVDVVELDNGRFSVSILPTRGMGIWKGTCDGLRLGWDSPVRQPVNPAFVNAMERGGLGWLYGFNEWICRCGLDSNGAPGTDVIIDNQGNRSQAELTLHGRIANLPAHRVEVSVDTSGQGTISVTGIVDETMMFGPSLRLKSTVRTTAGSNRISLIDEITNRRATPAELELLYHINNGPPFLEQEARLVAPVAEVAPRDARAAEGIDQWNVYGPPVTGFVEQAYFFDFVADRDSRTLALLRNAHGDKGLSVHFDKRQLPYFTLWKNTQAEADGYVTGLEPATNYPNLKTFERKMGRVILLAPVATFTAQVDIAVHSTGQQVAAVEQEINALQARHAPRVHRTPQEKFSPQ